jgi:hypothetical protein
LPGKWRLERQHVKQGTATLTTEKTGMLVSLPILPVLLRTLDAGPCGDLAFIIGAKATPAAGRNRSPTLFQKRRAWRA